MIDQLNEIVDALKAMNGTPALWTEVATIYRNALDAMMAAGFTREEAITILSRQGAMNGLR